ncbi:MAG: hypothetical protein WHU10_00080 [Fimbriimonadales bacterium]
MMTENDPIRRRIARANEDLLPIWRKVYSLRRLVAGDTSVVGGPAANTETDAAGRSSELLDFYVDAVREGRSNRLLEVVRTLLYQATFQMPTIEFSDVKPELAAINQAAVETLLGEPPRGCAALAHLRRALVDYMIGGIGWARITFDPRTAIPGVAYADSLDMLWDNRAATPELMRWAACKVRETLGYWRDVFGAKGPLKDGDPEKIVEVVLYYDTDTKPKGKFAAYLTTGHGAFERLAESDNPFYYEGDGVRVPYLPYEPMYYVWLPSVRYPVGIVEMALADQLAVWQSEDILGSVVQRMPPWYAVQEGAMDEESLKSFLEGEVGAIVEYKRNANPPAQMGGGDVPPTLLQRLQYHEKRMVGQVGVNPYASGSPVSGVQYATEVVAISQNASLNAQTVARSFAVFYSRVVRKFLGALSVYGDFDITLRVNEVPVRFGPHDPLAQYIAPDAHLTVKEDSAVFVSRAEKLQEAGALLQMAMALGQAFPNALPLAFRKYLLAIGETGKEWMEPAGGQPQQASPADVAQRQSASAGIPAGTKDEKSAVGGAAGILSKLLK